MLLLNRILSSVMLLAAMAPAQQGPGPLVLPPRRALGQSSPVDPVLADPCSRAGYANKHECSVAALLAGNDAENIGRRRERAMGLYMLSVERDPAYARPVFNLGVMSAKSGLWEDALKFYREAGRLDSAHQLGDAVEGEVLRVDMIGRLEATPDGKRRRQFDMQLADLTAKFNDPAIALDDAQKLIKFDPSRWEGPAAAGIMQAVLGKYDDSAKSLDAAARLASPQWRAKLTTAGELARQEGQYIRLAQEADAAMDKKQYDNAAKLYADAWQASPARVETGMKSVVAFLMADQVPLAVQTLTRLRQTGPPEISEKSGQMLKELGAVSADAKAAASLSRSGETGEVVDVGARVRTTLGDLRSPESKLATAPHPALLSDDLKFVHVSDDAINSPKELVLVSTQSLFSVYQSRVGKSPAPPSPGPALPEPVAPPPPADPPPSNLPARPERFGAPRSYSAPDAPEPDKPKSTPKPASPQP